MLTSGIPFQAIDWSNIEKIVQLYESASVSQQTISFEGLRIRMVEYFPGYIADHWCRKGHIVHCLKGSFVSELETGGFFSLSEGMSYVVSDNMSSHRSLSKNGVTLLIIDGDFLQEPITAN